MTSYSILKLEVEWEVVDTSEDGYYRRPYDNCWPFEGLPEFGLYRGPSGR